MFLRNYFASRARFLSTPNKLCSGILISYHAIGIAPQACACGHKTYRISSQSVSPTVKRCEYTLHEGEISSGREDIAGKHLNERQENSGKEKQNPAMKTINGRTYEQGGNLKRKEIISLLAERMAQLPELQKKVLAMYYHENMQLFKIAAIFGVTESRICQILGQAVTQLRDYLTELFA